TWRSNGSLAKSALLANVARFVGAAFSGGGPDFHGFQTSRPTTTAATAADPNPPRTSSRFHWERGPATTGTAAGAAGDGWWGLAAGAAGADFGAWPAAGWAAAAALP